MSVDMTGMEAFFQVIPWLFAGLVVLAGGLLAWKVGVPAVQIASLKQHITLMELQLKTAIERAELAEGKSLRYSEQLAASTSELKTANMQIAQLLSVFVLKTEYDRRQLGEIKPGTTQTVTTTLETTTKP
jgi:hypothetical protein